MKKLIYIQPQMGTITLQTATSTMLLGSGTAPSPAPARRGAAPLV